MLVVLSPAESSGRVSSAVVFFSSHVPRDIDSPIATDAACLQL